MRTLPLSIALVAGGAAFAAGPPPRQPVYVGARACGRCHERQALGNQYGHWLLSKHAQAYAALAKPEAKPMARLSGITDPPEKAPVCLGCHATAADAEPWERDPGFVLEDGVQCEKCHGAGSEYMEEAVMRDPEAARKAGLRTPTKHYCLLCHYVKGSHVDVHRLPPLDIEEAWKRLAHPTHPDPAVTAEAPRAPSAPVPAQAESGADHWNAIGLDAGYKTPLSLAFSPDGKQLYVACEAGRSVIVVDALRRRKVAEIPVGGQPADVTFSPDGARAYVSNRLDDTVSVIEVASRKVVRTFPVGDEPHGLLTDRTGRRLFVLNSATDDISVVDTESGKELRRLAASRHPWSLALSPDGKRLLVTNALSRFAKFRSPADAEITVLDAEGGFVENRLAVPAANLLLGIAWHPSGEFGLFTLNRTKNLVPMTRMLQGWTITNGLGIVWRDGRVDQVLLDEPNGYFADATDVALTPDGKYALATSAGTDRVAVIDVAKLIALVQGTSAEERRETLPNHLGSAAQFVVKHISTKNSPRGILVAPDGKTAWVANALDDSLTVIDVPLMEVAARVDLGGPRVVTKVRRGERLFNSANIAFQRQLSCHTCHPDGHVDGLTYDVEADGIGVSPVDNRSLRGIYDTDPFKWEGTNPSLARQCGARLAVFFTRIQPFTPEELSAVNDFTVTIPRPPNRHRPLGAALTEAQRRGKVLFERSRTNDGRDIDVDNRCVTCHFPPYYTDRSRRDVGSQHLYDRQGKFDVPALLNIYDSAPYMHNGMADTLEEIWTRFNPYDTHGVTNDMTKDQLNDLIEYLKTL